MGYKIQMIAPTSFFADTGCHVRILEEIWSLQKAGHTVTVCTYHMGNDVEGVDIRRSLDVPWRKGVQVGSSRHKLYFDAMLAFKSFQVAWKEKPDIIHAHLHEGALIGFLTKWLIRFGKTPLVFDFQGSLTSEMIDHHFLRKRGPFYRPALALERLINRMPDRIITSSHNAHRLLLNRFKVRPDRVQTAIDRVNCERFRPAQNDAERAETARLRESLGIPADRKVVVYLGLLAEYQGINVLLEAAQQLKTEMPEAFFVIMGYPGVDKYAKLAEELGLKDNVILPGRIPYQDAPKYLRLGDVAVAPKMSESEGAGKISNYMAMGLPVVSFDTAISREIMGELGVYAEMGSASSLAHELKTLLLDEKRRHKLGAQLRATAMANLGMNRTHHELERVYEQVLGRKAQRQPIVLAEPADGSRYELGVAADGDYAHNPGADGGLTAADGGLATGAADSGTTLGNREKKETIIWQSWGKVKPIRQWLSLFR